MKNIRETKPISELLNTFAFGDKPKGKSLTNAIKFSTIFSFWEDIIGTKLAKYTKPVKIKYSKFYVCAKSPAVIQEINFNKQKILQKLNSYSQALSITVKDLVLDYKQYEAETKQKDLYIEDKVQFYNNSSLEGIELDCEYKNNIKNAVDKISFLGEDGKNKLIDKIYNAKKAQIKRQK